ncbi:MAG: tetratricopeptide repeat protein [Bacteroidota bacterium]
MKYLRPFYIFLLFSLLFQAAVMAQTPSLKDQAKSEFKKEHYTQAISLLEKAAKESPDDAEIFYLLGFYTHYNAYDSRPLAGYNDKYSDAVFRYLDRALELKPDYGDAKYFYGAECSANAFKYMHRRQADNLKKIYKKAYDKGAYPEWLLEFGRNFMNTCDQNAILFTGGNPDFDACTYLQLHENFRKDITVIPISAMIDRTWYVSFLKKGLPGAVRSINIDLTEEQIDDMRPFKWDTTVVTIPISDALKTKLKLPASAVMNWSVAPDLVANRTKQEDPKKKRTLLSPQRAVLLSIIESNKWERPVYFSNAAVEEFFGGLKDYFRNCGLTSELLPVKTKDTKWVADKYKLEKLFSDPGNFRYYKTIKTKDIPRISGMTMFYFGSAVNLAEIYSQEGNRNAITKLAEFCKQNLAVGYKNDAELYYLDEITNYLH